MDARRIVVLGAGNILLTDEGLGIRALQALESRYTFPENVSLMDGGTLGLSLLACICEADDLIVLDAIKNNGAPGDLYRICGEEIPKRIRAKNSIHQVDFLETLAVATALDQAPQTVILGLEPQDIQSVSLELSPEISKKLPRLVEMAVAELARLGVAVMEKQEE